MFQMDENSSKAMLSLLNIVLFVLPLITLIFTTIHYYNSYEFIELMSSQPMSRTKIITSEYAGVSISLLSAFLAGVGLPVLFYAPVETGFTLLFAGIALTLIFTSIAFFTSVLARDKARGIGLCLLVWFYLALIYDGLLLLVLFTFSDYPMERVIIGLISFNPIDLARVFFMLKMDISVLMGNSGAIMKDFLGNSTGLLFTAGIMLVWIVVPLWLAIRKFNTKDL
jgi:Cu-processing system permease protein